MATLILVTGTGRSGTSAMAGTLHYLGLDVPGPWHDANDSNPKGFFESEWSMDFHKRLCAAAAISDVDSRPTAYAQVQEAVTPGMRDELAEFLRGHADLEQLVIKDPRTIWTQWLWRDVARSLGRQTRYVSMLRHPAEVVGSRSSHYNADEARGTNQQFQTMSLARWINNSLVNEYGTRDEPRAFVRYADLMADWRSVMRALATDLGLSYSVDPEGSDARAVDDWIEPELRRHAPSWTGMDIPGRLVELAEGVWEELSALADHHDAAPEVSARLDDLNRTFTAHMADAANTAQDSIRTAYSDGRRREQPLTQAAKRREAEARTATRKAVATVGRQREQLVKRRERIERQHAKLERHKRMLERRRQRILQQRERIEELSRRLEEERARRWNARLRRLLRRVVAPFRRSS